MTRTLPTSLARIVEQLELNQVFLVTIEEMERLRRETGARTSARLIAQRLRDKGWLLPTGQLGVWEFAPAAHAGPISRGHPFAKIKAAKLADPTLNVAICLNSALWAHNLTPRAPEKPEVALRHGVIAPAALKRAARVTHFEHNLDTVTLQGTAVHAPATILVHMAARPTAVRSWSAALEALPELMDLISTGDVQAELKNRPASVHTRLAYLIHGISPGLADTLSPPGNSKVWFGPRGPLRRHNQRFNIADTALPISPAELHAGDRQ